MDLADFDKVIRRIPDFPKPGINFYDVTSILTNSKAFRFCIQRMHVWAAELGADTLLAVESRGFLFASALAEKHELPLVLARKKGKLPGETWNREYSLEYGWDCICVHKADLLAGSRVLLVDDLIATGGTLQAAARIVTEDAGAEVVGFSAVIGLPFLGYENLLTTGRINTIINYDEE